LERNRAAIAVVVVIGVMGVAAALWWFSGAGPTLDGPPVIPGDSGERVMVEVLNGSQIDGLARRVTQWLRRKGVDVVYYGTARDSLVHQTQLIIRRGDSVTALALRDLLGFGLVLNEPAERLLLDVSVILGTDASEIPGLNP